MPKKLLANQMQTHGMAWKQLKPQKHHLTAPGARPRTNFDGLTPRAPIPWRLLESFSCALRTRRRNKTVVKTVTSIITSTTNTITQTILQSLMMTGDRCNTTKNSDDGKDKDDDHHNNSNNTHTDSKEKTNNESKKSSEKRRS